MHKFNVVPQKVSMLNLAYGELWDRRHLLMRKPCDF